MPRTVNAGARHKLDAEGGLAVADPALAVFAVGGRPYAIDDVCPHRGCPLSAGTLDGAALTCTCHGSQFDVTTGALLRGPATTGVRAYPARYDGDDVIVELPEP